MLMEDAYFSFGFVDHKAIFSQQFFEGFKRFSYVDD
jgi:hypothetical protein